MNHIPVHLLKERTQLGIQLKRFRKGDVFSEDAIVLQAHRDDHYLFFLVESDGGSMMIDFEEMLIPERSIFYVQPHQVHQRIRNEGVDGWFIAVDTTLVPAECRNVFEGILHLQKPYPIDEIQQQQFIDLLTLISQKCEDNITGSFQLMVIHSLLRSFIAMVAECYHCVNATEIKVSRPAQLTAQFRDMLTSELRAVKSPAEYAARLNVSEAYLSEALKKTTGFPASYWIQQEIMMEAKRLLYYSELTVKQIAHDLGYADHSYFSRLFRKVTGVPAIIFREQYRK